MSEAADLFKALQDAKDCKSLLKKHLTQERFDKLKDLKSKFGGTLADCIRSGKNYFGDIFSFLFPFIRCFFLGGEGCIPSLTINKLKKFCLKKYELSTYILPKSL